MANGQHKVLSVKKLSSYETASLKLAVFLVFKIHIMRINTLTKMCMMCIMVINRRINFHANDTERNG